MKLTPVKFYRLALLLPYAAGVLLIGVSSLFEFLGVSPMSEFPENLTSPSQIILIIGGAFVGILTVVTLVYTIGAIYWLIPYTVLAISLYIWSLNKNKSQIYKRFMWSPVFLAILIIIQIALVTILKLLPNISSVDDFLAPGFICAFPASVGVGYFLIGVAAWIYDFLRRRGVIVDEDIITSEGSMRN